MSADSPLLSYLFTHEPSFRKARLPSLYSDFNTLRILNPDGYAANIDTWISCFSSALRSGSLPPDLLILSFDESLFRALQTKECGRPLSLGTVVSEALARKSFIGLRDFRDAKDSIYGRKWTIKVPSLSEVFSWGLKQLGLGFGGGKIDGMKVVVLSNLEEVGKAFEYRMKGQRSRVDRLWSLPAFKSEFQDLLSSTIGLSIADFDVLLQFLQRDRGLVSWNGEVVKLRAHGEVDGITSEDMSIANLKTLIAHLHIQLKTLEGRVDELNMTARNAVEKKNRIAAMSALRSKKLAETTLGKRHATLAQLEDLFGSIEQAANHVELMRVMQGSAKVLGALNKEIGGVERVDDVVDNLREEMAKVSEVGDVIREAGQQHGDEGEVDDELQALENEERRKMEEVERNERESRERKETEETRKKLDALDDAESTDRDKAVSEKTLHEADNENERDVDESVKGLKRMSLEPSEKVSA